jgi:hypothetical protein
VWCGRMWGHGQGGAIYGGGYNEMEAYLYFTRACMEYLHQTGRQPHIIHYHDWHTAVAPVLYWDIYHPLGLNQVREIVVLCPIRRRSAAALERVIGFPCAPRRSGRRCRCTPMLLS